MLMKKYEDRLKTIGESEGAATVTFFSQDKIGVVTNLIIATMLTLLFVAPISVLYYLSSNTSGLRRALASVGVLMSFTLLFTALTSTFTRAKRHEVTAASAAYVLQLAFDIASDTNIIVRYCAVLAVFFGNVS